MSGKNLIKLIGIFAVCFGLLAAMLVAPEAPDPTVVSAPVLPQEETVQEKLYAFPPAENIRISGIWMRNELVDVRYAVSGIRTKMIYAGPDNFTGETLYAADLCLLQKETAEKIKKAQEVLTENGYQLLICDAYRPSSVQERMYEVLGDTPYLVNPNREPSNHSRGAAVDVTLLDEEGKPVLMPSQVDTFDATAHREYRPGPGEASRSPEAQRNMEYLTAVMKDCGFTVIQSEWWHFNDSEAENYPATDLDFTAVPMLPAEKEI